MWFATMVAGGRRPERQIGGQPLGGAHQHRHRPVGGVRELRIARDRRRRFRTSPRSARDARGRSRDRPAPPRRTPTAPRACPSLKARSRRSAKISNPWRATSSIRSSRPRKWRYGAAGLTPARRAASAMLKPSGPFSSISLSAASHQSLAQVAVVIGLARRLAGRVHRHDVSAALRRDKAAPDTPRVCAASLGWAQAPKNLRHRMSCG